jgi:hypothetical protein
MTPPNADLTRIIIANSSLTDAQITYRNIMISARAGRNFEIPPAWTKGEAHACNANGWLNKSQYTKWGRNSKFLDFCFRLRTGVLHARRQLYRYGFVTSPECTLCNEPEQTVQHLLWDCPVIIQIKIDIASNWGKPVEIFDPSSFGFVLHITARVLHTIYTENIISARFTVQKLLATLYQTLDTDKAVMGKQGRTASFLALWNEFHRPI